MSALKFDYELMRTNVIPQLDSVKATLDGIYDKLNSMSIPNFDKTNYLNETKIDMNNKVNEINHIIDWLYESNRILDNLIDSYEKESKFLPLYALNKRDSVIK